MELFEKNARMTEQDIATLKAAFEQNDGLAVVLRKILYPELTADAPIHLNNDLMTNYPLGDDKDMALVKVLARQMLVQHVEGSLNVIRTLVGKKEESPEQILKRLQKDSSR